MTDRIQLDAMTSDALDALYVQLDALRAVARGYCPACGRGDAAPTVEDWEREKQRADQAEADIAAVRDRVRAHHQPITGDGGPYCQTCTQEDRQPPPIGWWVPYPCPTVAALDTPEPTP